MKNGKRRAAYWGNGDPAEGRPCPTCGARIGKPCTSTVGTSGVPINGMHAERVSPSEIAA